MKKYVAALALAVALAGTAVYAGGGGGGGGGRGGGGGGMGGAGGGFGGGRGGFGFANPNPAPTITAQITDLTPDQTTKLTAASTDLDAALAAWQTSSAAALTPLQAQPGTPPDAAAQKKLADETYKQNLLREDILTDAELKMIAILTPAQAAKWETSRLTTQAAVRFGTLGLTDDQAAKRDALIKDYATKLVAIKDKVAYTKMKAEFWAKTLTFLNETQTTQIFARHSRRVAAASAAARAGLVAVVPAVAVVVPAAAAAAVAARAVEVGAAVVPAVAHPAAADRHAPCPILRNTATQALGNSMPGAFLCVSATRAARSRRMPAAAWRTAP